VKTVTTTCLISFICLSGEHTLMMIGYPCSTTVHRDARAKITCGKSYRDDHAVVVPLNADELLGQSTCTQGKLICQSLIVGFVLVCTSSRQLEACASTVPRGSMASFEAHRTVGSLSHISIPLQFIVHILVSTRCACGVSRCSRWAHLKVSKRSWP
jgi:hypothetical protein